jgi:hypothetical protein
MNWALEFCISKIPDQIATIYMSLFKSAFLQGIVNPWASLKESSNSNFWRFQFPKCNVRSLVTFRTSGNYLLPESLKLWAQIIFIENLSSDCNTCTTKNCDLIIKFRRLMYAHSHKCERVHKIKSRTLSSKKKHLGNCRCYDIVEMWSCIHNSAMYNGAIDESLQMRCKAHNFFFCAVTVPKIMVCHAQNIVPLTLYHALVSCSRLLPSLVWNILIFWVWSK